MINVLIYQAVSFWRQHKCEPRFQTQKAETLYLSLISLGVVRHRNNPILLKKDRFVYRVVSNSRD